MSNKSFEIIDYTEKSIAVFGDTKSIKDNLKALGGRFNPRLSYNGEKAAGWIFPIHLRSEIEELLEMSDDSTDIENTFEIDKNEKHHDSNIGDFPKCVRCMNFQEAIISVINYYGKDILLKNTIINILNDYSAFQESKSFKVILKHIISEGYLDQILYMKSWDNTHLQLINRFVDNTGFQYDKALYVVSSLAYALGISQTSATYTISNQQQQLTSETIIGNKSTNISHSSLNLASVTTGKHLTFKGIEINGSLDDMRIQLENKGFSFVTKEENLLLMEGNFAGYSNCGIVVISSEYRDLVHRIFVYLPQRNQWDDLENDYIFCKELFAKKYGNPISNEYFKSPYEEGDGYEMEAVSTDNCTYISLYEMSKGNISVCITQDKKILLCYNDEINSELESEARNNQAYLDI